MKTLVFLLEEPSAKAMLQGVLPRMLPVETSVRYMVFEGKQDLHKQIVKRLRHWQQPDSVFIIIQDQDSNDCRELKQALQRYCVLAGRPDALVRIACHELESFYLGDLAAVEQGLGLTGLALRQDQRKFRAPDKLGSPCEDLKVLTGGHYQKVSGSRAIGPFLRLDGGNRSHSFNVLISGALRMAHV